MTQLEHFMYIRIMYQEADNQPRSLQPVFEELQKYCKKFNADYCHTVILL
ncbi:hypothetical protein [Bacillus phage PK16]|nr:hypothetical protein [Bacillus phage PK16]AUM59007.1 hypothetical protein BCP01_206 [Bacillus phage BCP01]UJH95717.1 hypothetical protein [Bacillus phage vB_BtM_BMBsp2]WQZ49340.1 hypothetical protein Z3_24 [Bacillus phage Z3]